MSLLFTIRTYVVTNVFVIYHTNIRSDMSIAQVQQYHHDIRTQDSWSFVCVCVV